MIPIAKPLIGEKEKRAVLEVLDSGALAQGLKVKQFEENFASYVGVEYAIAMNSGTAALHTALLAAGIGSGDEVITTPFSFIATANAILYCGAKPVFADINAKTFNIHAEKIREKITKRTKAVLAVHLYGQPCNIDAIKEICEDHRLKLIEDACQAHGAEYWNRRIGSLGECAAFSFYPTKNMTTGEGGMITTSDAKITERARIFREHGSKVRYYHEVLGYNYRMTDVAAAIGTEQLKKLDAMNDKRIKNAELLTSEIKKIEGLETPYISSCVKHVFHQYTIRVKKEYGTPRNELVKKLNQNGIGTGIYYPLPMHKQKLYKKLGYDDRLPVAERAAREVLSLPVHAGVSGTEIRQIISSLSL